MSDHPCVSRRLRKEKGTFVIIGFVKWKEKNMGPSKKHARDTHLSRVDDLLII